MRTEDPLALCLALTVRTSSPKPRAAGCHAVRYVMEGSNWTPRVPTQSRISPAHQAQVPNRLPGSLLTIMDVSCMHVPFT